MHYVLANLLLCLLLPFRRARLDLVIAVLVFMAVFTAYYMSGSADYKGYVTYFLCSQNEFCLKSGELNFERSYALISNFFYTFLFREGASWVIAFYSTVALCIKLPLLQRYSRHFGVALLCYAMYAWYVHEMTQIRIGLAIAFYWLAVIRLTQKRYVGAAVYFAFTLFFHVSTILGIVALLLRPLKTSSRRMLTICGLITLFGVGISDSPAFLGAILSFGFVDPRLATYSDAIGNIVSSTNFLTVYLIASATMLVMYALIVPHDEETELERLSFRLGCFGLAYYGFLYWIPTVGLRGFEFFLCLLPFTAAGIFRSSKGILPKLLVILLCVLTYWNLVIRNGTRTDFILPGQAQEQWME